MGRKPSAGMLVWTVLAGMLGGAAAARLVMVQPAWGQGRSRVVEAEEFRLVEKDGKPCARLHVDRSGRPALTLIDKHGEVRAVLGISPNGSPHLALSDKDGKVRVALAVWSDERAGLFVSDSAGTPRAALAAVADGQPSLSVSDREGNARAVVGAASLELIPGQSFRNRSESSLALLDKDGKVLWAAP